MNYNKDVVLQMSMWLSRRSEARTEEEIIKSLKNETNEEHDYLKGLYDEMKEFLK